MDLFNSIKERIRRVQEDRQGSLRQPQLVRAADLERRRQAGDPG